MVEDITKDRNKPEEDEVFELVDDEMTFEGDEMMFESDDEDGAEVLEDAASPEEPAEEQETGAEDAPADAFDVATDELPAADPVLDDEFERELAARREKGRAAEKTAPDDKYRSMAEKFDSNVDYTTVLDSFEGPLDLLLYLINREEIEIKDIFVSQVTEQFLEYMKGLPYIDVDKVTEYLNIAATIIKIKAQSLVPLLDDMEEYYDDDIEDDKAELIRALEEYRLIKDEMEKLKKMETIGYYFKEPDKDVGETKTVFSLDNLTLDGLVKAMSALLIKRADKLDEGEVREIPRDEYTVEQKIYFILEVFEETQELRFEELFTRDYTHSEIVTTFQALLELLKHQYLHVRQPEAFGQIYITFNAESTHQWVGQQIDEYE